MTARILVVDDVLANVKVLCAKLTAEYFEVLTARDGPSAIKIAEAEAPDLILLDVMMPGMDGFEVAERLKANQNTLHIPIVMLTALSETSDRIRGLEAGADDFLSKPVNTVALLARVRSLIRLKMMTDELRIRHAATGQLDVFDETILGGQEETANARILVVDDSDATASKVVDYLTTAGHKVDHVSKGADALTLSRDNEFDIILVSLYLADEDGLRLCSQLRSQDETRQVPILLILEGEELSQLAKGLDLGVTDYLVKPVDRNELAARTRTQIRRRRYHRKLRDMFDQSVAMAYTDELTGVYNRRYMSVHLERKIMGIAETAKPVSVMMLDIDHFKKVNDTYGHASGDDVLKGAAKYICDNIRNFDLVARYGGEEFVVIMPDTPEDVAMVVAERLRRRFVGQVFPFSDQGDALPVTVSIGVATTVNPMETADKLLERVDKALYEAKESGRNQVVSADIKDPIAVQRAFAASA